MRRETSRGLITSSALVLTLIISGCSGNSSSSTESKDTGFTTSTRKQTATEAACSKVDLPFDESRKYSARLRNKAATVDEVIAAYKTAADAFSSAAEIVSVQHVGIFRGVALAFNQSRVALETDEPMDEFAIEDGQNAAESYMRLCNKSFDFEST
jgi:hypothetical protein